MDIELVEIRDFLAGHHPFDLLPEDALNTVTRSIQIRYLRKGTVLMAPGDKAEFLYQIRTGAVETHDPEGQLLARLGEGDFFGVRSLLGARKAVNRSTVIEDCLAYLIPADVFDDLRATYAQIEYFFAPYAGGGLGNAASLASANGGNGNQRQVNLMTLRIGDMLARAPVTIDPGATIADAAARMRDERVSCLLVTGDGRLQGIFTDRDLRNRVVAEGVPYAAPVADVMTADPICVDVEDYGFDALMAMSRNNIHHLPVLRDGGIAGCITTTNLVKTQTTSSVFLVGDLYKQTSAEGLGAVLKHIPELVLFLTDSGASAHHIGHVVSALTDATTTRLIQLAIEKLGPPPIPYAWMAAGSQARHEQTAHSDQDNFLILDDSFSEAEHGAYFRAFSKFVCDGLNTCGYVYCPGEAMAMTDEWRQPLRVWREYFRRWIEEPEPKALMLSCIFFDLRLVDGDPELIDDLRRMIPEACKANRIFQAYMAANALQHQPPLGFFRNLVLIRGGEHHQTLDLKHGGVVPIIDLARVYALAAGSPRINTQNRLRAAEEAGTLSRQGAADLRDAFDFISLLRLRNQAEMIRRGEPADNFLTPKKLSSFERSHLEGAFRVVKTLQAAMGNTYQAGRF